MTVRKVTEDVGKGAHCATDTSRGILASVKWKKVMKWKKVRGFLILFNALLDFSFKALRLRLSTIGCWAEHLAWTAHSVDKGQRDQRDIVRTLRPTTTNNQQQKEEGRRRCSWSCERIVEDRKHLWTFENSTPDTHRGLPDAASVTTSARNAAFGPWQTNQKSELENTWKVCEKTWSPNKAKKQGSCRAWRILENQVNKHLEPVSFRKHSNKLHLCALEESKSPAKLLFRFAAAATLKSVPVLSQHQQFSRLWPLLPTADDTRLGKIRLAPGT